MCGNFPGSGLTSCRMGSRFHQVSGESASGAERRELDRLEQPRANDDGIPVELRRAANRELTEVLRQRR
jgi:hypothetical protein